MVNFKEKEILELSRPGSKGRAPTSLFFGMLKKFDIFGPRMGSTTLRVPRALGVEHTVWFSDIVSWSTAVSKSNLKKQTESPPPLNCRTTVFLRHGDYIVIYCNYIIILMPRGFCIKSGLDALRTGWTL